MLKQLSSITQVLASIAAPASGTAVPLNRVKTFSAQCNITVNTAAQADFTAVASTDILTSAAHGLFLGSVVQVSNSGGGLPAGLSALTNYFVIPINANTFYLATTLANAQAGTHIDITTNGTGTQTFTPTALASGSVQLQKSNDGTNWVNEGSSVSVGASGSFWLEKVDPAGAFMRVAYSLASGSFLASTVILSQGHIS